MNSNLFGRQSIRFTGQHFTKNRSLICAMIKEGDITKTDLVLDIGAGKGALTIPLAKIAKRVIAIERDSILAQNLTDLIDYKQEVKVLNMDIRNMPFPSRVFKVVSNIPYMITRDIFGKLMDVPNPNFAGGIIVTEWGAALKLTKVKQASPRIVGWNTQYEMGIIQKIPNHMFRPPPTVDSAMIKISPRSNVLIPYKDFYSYMSFLYTLLNPHGVMAAQSLRKVFTKTQVKRIFSDAGIDKNALIQDLNTNQWVYCFKIMQKFIPAKLHPKMPGKYKKRHKCS